MTIESNKFTLQNCVFIFDVKNPNSWFGVPTTNYLVTSTWGQANCMGRSDKRPFSTTSHSSNRSVTRGVGFTNLKGGAKWTPEETVKDIPVWMVTNSNPDNYSRFSPHAGFNIDELPALDTSYVVSSYIYIPPNITLGTGNTASVTQNNTGSDWQGGGTSTTAAYNATYTFWAGNPQTANSPANNNLRGVWQRVYSRFTPSTTVRNQESASGVTINKLGGYFNPSMVGQADANFYYVTASQLEPGLYPSPYVHGTRGATEAAKDLISNRTITAANLIGTADGGFSFNGSTPSSSLTFPMDGLNFASEITITIVLKPTENDGSRRNPFHMSYGGYGSITHEPSGAFNYYHGTNGGNGLPYQGYTSNFNVVQNETAVITLTRGPSTIKWYKNGVFINSTTNSYPTAASNVTTASIGTGYAGAYLGEIGFVALHDRQLSDSEVYQNFNAIRKKFGLQCLLD